MAIPQRIGDLINLTKNFLRDRKTSYQLTFRNPQAQVCLQDLIKFCKANESCWGSTDAHRARLEGRREVWLRIQQHLGLSVEELFALYNGQPIKITQEESEND
jgi:hypothetical protein